MSARYATDAGMAQRRFSHAIAEGDGISVVAAVEDADSARAAEEHRAEALVVRGDPSAVREASSLPILWRADVSLERASTAADAYLLVFDALDDEDGRLEELHAQAVELGLDCAVEVRDEEELEQALERVDPEIFLLSPLEREEDETPLEVVLDLLAAVPAGKLAIADLELTTRDEVLELERAGCDAVIVHGRAVAALVGGPPPEV
jgi:indole-3-glycerol phosphate synthase